MNPSTRRPKRLVPAGVAAASLSLAGAGAAMAANGAPAPADEAPAVSPAPDAPEAPEAGAPTDAEALAREAAAIEAFTQEQYDAFWASGYTTADVDALGALWGTEYTETKSRVGQMLLDGTAIPIAPGSTPVTLSPGQAEAIAFWDSGYTWEDAEALAALWGIDTWDTKVRAGTALLAGETLPIAPGASVTP